MACFEKKYHNTFCHRRRILLRCLNNSVMSSNIDPDMFLSKVFQLRDKLSDLGEIVFNGRSKTIIIDALPDELYSTIKVASIREPEFGLEKIIGMMRAMFINHSERSSGPKWRQESYHKYRDNSGRETTMNDRESAMTTAIACHNCKRPGHKKKSCNRLNENSDKLGSVEDGTRK